MKKLFLFCVILLITFIQFRSYLQKEFPYTHDGENHLARFANYKIAIKEGQIPPRFAPNLMNHYGYPVFNFNYPLANILSVPFSFIKINPELTFKMISLSFFIFGLLGIYQLSQLYKLSYVLSGITIALFGLHPYFANIILYRGNIGEFIALCLVPWLLVTLHIPFKTKKVLFGTVAVWISFFLSHNVSVVLLAPWLLLYGALRYRNNFTELKKKIAIIFLSLFATFWFWLPALMEASYTVVHDAGIAKDFLRHFPTIAQLLFGQLQFGFSLPGSIDSLSFQFGLAQWLVILISGTFIIKKFTGNHIVKLPHLFFFLTMFSSIFFQLSYSSWFWKLIPALQIIQFPWRLTVFSVITVPLLFIHLSHYLSKQHITLLVSALLLQLIILYNLLPVDFFHKNQIDYDLYAQSTSTQNENRTKDFNYLEIGDWQPKPGISEGSTSQVLSWTGSYRKYTVDFLQAGTVIEPTMLFPGWETTMTNAEEKTIAVQYLDPKITQGRLAFQIPAGKYTIVTRFTEKTPVRLIGDTISIFSLLLLLGIHRTLITRHEKAKA